MPNAKADSFRQLNNDDLDKRINEAYRNLFALRFRHASRQLENYRALRAAKREIARLRTLKRERELESAAGAGE